MSFYTEFHAVSTFVAREELAARREVIKLPGMVEEFIHAALAALESARYEGAVHVLAQGHLHDGKGYHSPSNLTVEVSPATVVGLPVTESDKK